MVGHAFEQIPLLAQLPAGERAELATSLQTFTLPAGALLFREGDSGDRFYTVVDGEVEILKSMGTEDERLLHVQGPGTFLGEISLLEQDGLRTASVRARVPVTGVPQVGDLREVGDGFRAGARAGDGADHEPG